MAGQDMAGQVKTLLNSLPFWWILAGAMAVLAILGFCHKPAQSAMTDKEKIELTALRDTKARDAAVIDSLKRTSQDAVSRANEQQQQSTTSRQHADVSRGLADKLAVSAQATVNITESAAIWKAAYDARTKEADTLRSALAHADSASADRERARQAIASAFALSESRRARAEALNEDLAKTITKAGQCKILFVPCVSRPVAFVTGVVVGAGVGIYLKR